jgi:hypothetical protein
MLDETSQRMVTSPNSLIKLKRHQEAMLYKMMEIEKISNIGVMSDFPGSGKSFPILSLISWDKLLNDHTQNILVVPHNLFTQWISYIKLFPRLTFLKFIEYSDISSLLCNINIIYNADILLTTSLYYSTICKSLPQNFKIKRIIIDEIDSSDFFISHISPAMYTWFVSASFDINKIGKNKINVNLDTITCKCKDSFIDFNLPKPNYIFYNCYDKFADMNIFFDEHLQLQVNAMDYSMKFKNLSKTAKNSKELANYIIQDILISINKYENYLKNKSLDPVIKKEYQDNLNKFNDKKKNLFDRINETMCPICLDEFDETFIKLFLDCCKNVFCKSCLEEQIFNLNDKCPKCRKPIDFSTTIEINENKNNIKHIEKKVEKNLRIDKIECCQNILNKINKDSKLIIFSDYQNVFKIVVDILQKKGIIFSELDGGDINMIDKDVESYKNGHTQVLLINSCLYGAGLNFENTTDVIILHKSKSQQQIIGRAQRPGRTSALNVHYLLYENE